MNLTSAAAQLGVTPQQLQAALGFPAGGYQSSGQGFLSNTTLLNAAAAQARRFRAGPPECPDTPERAAGEPYFRGSPVGVTPQQLQAALGFP